MENFKSHPTKTVLTISVGFVFVYFITKWNWVLAVSFIVGLLGIVSDYMSQKIDFVWMQFAHLMGLIVPNIFLGLIFYLFLFPISMLSRLFGKKDPLHLKNHEDSLFTVLHKDFDKASFEKAW